MAIVPNGKATHPFSLAPPLDCQDVSKYPADDWRLDCDSVVERRADHAWRWVAAVAIVGAIAIAAVVTL